MPEFPDITVYVERLNSLAGNQRLERIRLASPFLLRTVDPPLAAFEQRTLRRVNRMGKRVVLGFEDELWLVIHLMVAGRLQWEKPGAKIPARGGLAAFDFHAGTLTLTEAGTKKRVSLHAVRGVEALALHDPGGLEVLEAEQTAFRNRLTLENHTLKRALTDPRIFSGIGNAYSDEILHRAGLSPVAQTRKLSEVQVSALFRAARAVLTDFTDRIRAEAGQGFPRHVTAFRADMAVHGRFGRPCPACGTAVQRIRYQESETNYCPACQTEGKLLADRALSRLLKSDWPRSLEEMEERRERLHSVIPL